MAKGDSGRAQNQIGYQGGYAQNNLNNLRTELGGQQQGFFQNYNNAVPQNMGDYRGMLGQYQNFLGPSLSRGQGQPQSSANGPTPWGGGSFQDAFMNQIKDKPFNQQTLTDLQPWLQSMGSQLTPPNANGDQTKILDPSTGQWTRVGFGEGHPVWVPQGDGSNQGGGGAISGWQNFADTGGFSPQAIQDLRARMVAPTRAIYQNAQDQLARQTNLNPGMANFAPAQAKLARESSQAIGDQSTNANAAIAQMVQQGQLSGLQGLTGAQLGALAGMTGLYGATPGLSNMFGNQLLGSTGQELGLQGLQNQLGLGIMGAQNQKAQIPGNFQQALGNIGSIIGMGGTLAGMGGMYGNPFSNQGLGGYQPGGSNWQGPINQYQGY